MERYGRVTARCARHDPTRLTIGCGELISRYRQRCITIQTCRVTNECSSVSSGQVSLFSCRLGSHAYVGGCLPARPTRRCLRRRRFASRRFCGRFGRDICVRHRSLGSSLRLCLCRTLRTLSGWCCVAVLRRGACVGILIDSCRARCSVIDRQEHCNEQQRHQQKYGT